MSRKSSFWNCEFGMALPGENYNSSTNTTSTPENIDHRQQRTMQMLKDATLEIARNTLHRPLSMQEQARLDACLVNLIPELLNRSRPDHPPYTEMIYDAINSLREEAAGSSQASISSYIKSHYPDLPWAHETFLSHHLNRLTLKGQITKTRNGHYMLFESNPYQKGKKQEKEREEMATLVLVEPALEEVKPDKNKRRRSRKVKIEEQDVAKKGQYAAKVEAVVMGLAKVQNGVKKKLIRGGPLRMEEEEEWAVEKPKIPREGRCCLRRR